MITSTNAAVSVAVVIPAHNAAGTIERALRSVVGQSRAPEEIFVVDDGSDDDTSVRAAAFAPTATVLRTEHGGPSAARNVGTDAASAEYVAYLDADDQWVPHKLEAFDAVSQRLGRPDFLFSDFRRYMEKKQEFMPLTNTGVFSWLEEWPGEELVHEGRRVRIFTPAAALEALLKGYPIWPSTVVVRRSAVKEAGGWDTRFDRCQDLDLWLRTASTTGMVYVAEALTTVNVDAERDERWITRQLDWALRVMRHHAGPSGFFSPKMARLVRRYLGRHTVWRGDMSRRLGHRREAVRWYLEALRCPGGRLRGGTRLVRVMLLDGLVAAARRALPR